MAELEFEIHGKHGEISARTFREAISYAVSLLREYDAALTGKRRGTLSWYIRKLDSNGSLAVSFASRLKPSLEKKKLSQQPPDVSTAVTSHLLTGFEDIEEKCETPPYLSDYGLEKTDDLAKLIGKNGASGFRFASQSKSIEVTTNTSMNLRTLMPITRTAIGSVEGKLEGINLHGGARFIVYQAVSKKAVRCTFDDELMESVKNYLGKRVSVFGQLHKNIKGDTLRVAVQRLTEVDENRRFLVDSQGLGDPEFAETLSTEEYLRRVRGR